MKTHQLMRQLIHVALQAIEPESLVTRVMKEELAISRFNGPLYVLAIGKAACAMARGVANTCAERIVAGLVITPPAYRSASPYPLMGGAHPLPDEQSLVAGQAALAFVQSLPARAELLVLLSGGASACAEVLREGVGLDNWQKLNRALLSSGFDIVQINQVRQHFSLLKAGGLRRAAAPDIHIHQYIISDVVNDDPATIGSGPFIANTSDKVASFHDFVSQYVPELLPMMTSNAYVTSGNSLPASTSSLAVQTRIIANNQTAVMAVQQDCERRGLMTYLQSPIQGDVADVAQRCADILISGPPGVYLWGGESTVQLPAYAGLGGRNQHLALSLLQRLQGQAIALACVGSDGCDGQSPAAGACFDATAHLAAGNLGLAADMQQALTQFHSYDFFSRYGGLLVTGATGSNVMDLVIGYRY